MKHEAMYYEKLKDKTVKCTLCPNNCIIKPGDLGICRVRKNIGGELVSLNYGKISSLNIDPIEKKPIINYMPGSRVLSIGSFGCNFKCPFCQNYSIAQNNPKCEMIDKEEIIKKALQLRQYGNIGIAYTYNEPTVFYEYMFETASLAKENDLKNILVTNGYINRNPLMNIIQYIDAMNIDLKFYNEKSYNKYAGGKLSIIKDNIKYCSDKTHLEVTTLLIPGINDSDNEIENISKFIAGISKEIVLHLSRFFPSYKMTDVDVTPKETMYRAKKIALKYLDNVYLGNM